MKQLIYFQNIFQKSLVFDLFIKNFIFVEEQGRAGAVLSGVDKSAGGKSAA
ncbi:hypothetical protein [Klebsiella michiganensis]|uniref:hypothetical protein n=1 Tax=Klebsiella michiganensis TaxID=1134687 RepID=UPI00292EC85D|nr:hypothetical protein [Klebsiella michiganensis]